MNPRAQFIHLLRTSLASASLSAGILVVGAAAPQLALAQDKPAPAEAPKADPAPKYRTLEPKIKTDAELKEKRKEKDTAVAVKSDKFDMAPVDAFYRDFLVPRLTRVTAESINEARSEIQNDISNVEKNKEFAKAYNASLIKYMKSLINDKAFSPSTRINALALLGRLNSEVTKSGAVVPEAAVQETLIGVINPDEIDALTCSAISSLRRHLTSSASPRMSENNRKLLLSKLKLVREAPVPVSRTIAANDYLKAQILDCMTLIAKVDPEKEPAKLATEYLSPLLVKMLEEEKSEWVLEGVCTTIGSIKPINLSPEDIAKVEVGVAKFARSSMTSWKKRILTSAPSVPSSPSGMDTGGLSSGGSPGGRRGGSGSSGGSGGKEGESGGLSSGGGAPEAPARPTRREKPPELVNARRIAHQRFEKIHFALNGQLKKPAANAKAAEPAGLIKLVTEEAKQEKIKTLIEKIEKFQSDLNDDKVQDLASLTAKVGKSSKDIRLICIDISGEKKPEAPTSDESTDSLLDEGP